MGEDKKEPLINPSFILQTLTTGALLVAGFVSMRADLNANIQSAMENKTKLEAAQNQIYNLQSDIARLQVNLQFFREAYERDMNKYIRDAHGR